MHAADTTTNTSVCRHCTDCAKHGILAPHRRLRQKSALMAWQPDFAACQMQAPASQQQRVEWATCSLVFPRAWTLSSGGFTGPLRLFHLRHFLHVPSFVLLQHSRLRSGCTMGCCMAPSRAFGCGSAVHADAPSNDSRSNLTQRRTGLAQAARPCQTCPAVPGVQHLRMATPPITTSHLLFALFFRSRLGVAHPYGTWLILEPH